jgi:hypothetical protein
MARCGRRFYSREFYAINICNQWRAAKFEMSRLFVKQSAHRADDCALPFRALRNFQPWAKLACAINLSNAVCPHFFERQFNQQLEIRFVAAHNAAAVIVINLFFVLRISNRSFH